MIRKITATIAAAITLTAAATAQPRAIGLRLGPAAEVSYQHTMPIADSFLEASAGLDYIGQPGAKGVVTWNFVIGDPAWTSRGQWGFFVGGGLGVGYVNDQVTYKFNDEIDKVVDTKRANEIGTMTGIALQAGFEYDFPFPLKISLDMRPIVGIHVAYRTDRYLYNKRLEYDTRYHADHRVNFYQDGLYGFIPTLSVRYIF